MSMNLQVLCKLGRIGKDEIWQAEPVNEVSDQGNLNIPFYVNLSWDSTRGSSQQSKAVSPFRRNL